MRYAAGVEYDGTDYCGWQSQPGMPSVQAAIESALGKVAGIEHAMPVMCAGRTDTGVHALNQVVHFDTTAEREEKAWVFGANTELPAGISLRWARPVREAFHARFSATGRRYRYLLSNARSRPALARRCCGWVPRPLELQSMQQAAQLLCGEHDFSAFRAAECQSKKPVRQVHALAVQRIGNWLLLDISADGFLHHMVRNIVGSLVLIGQGDRPVDWLQEVLESRDRRQAGPTGEARGLFFLGPVYPAEFGLPESDTETLWQAAGLIPG